MVGRNATVAFVPLRNCLVNLPLSIHGPLIERGITPQSLVVEITITGTAPNSRGKNVEKAYVGWTGMPSQVSSILHQGRGAPTATERIEIDPQFASMISKSLLDGSTISIELLRTTPKATSVSVTPLTPDDWEILETNAEFVATHLLNQVRAVKEGGIVGCWVGGTTLVRFIVDSTTPSDSNALLLTTNTELIVAPKTRHAIPESQANTPHELAPSASTLLQNSRWEALSKEFFRLLPLELEDTVLQEDLQESLPVVYVSALSYQKFKAATSTLRCCLGHCPRPVAKADISDGPKEKEREKDKDSRSSKDEPSKVEVRVKSHVNVPMGHIWIGEKLRKEFDVESSFELFKFSPNSATKKKVEKPREVNGNGFVNGKPSSNGIMRSASYNKPPIPIDHFLDVTPLVVSPTLAGVDDKLEAIRTHVMSSLVTPIFTPSVTVSTGILVTGASGSGKTAIVKKAVEDLSKKPEALTHVIYVDCNKYSGDRHPVLKGKMKDWFDAACWHAPTVMVFDNLDRVLGAEVEHADSFPALHLAHTFVGMAVPALTASQITLIATAQGTASLHPLLSTTHLLGETVSLRGPTKAGRKDILSTLVKGKCDTSNLVAPSLDYATIAGQTEGYLPADLRDLVDKSIHQAAMRSMASVSKTLELKDIDFTDAQEGFVPLSLKEVKLQKSDIMWSDIGGLHETRRILRETLEWPTKYGAIFASCPLRLRSGLLLYGYPGCGKTLLASAVAKECGLNFISVKGPEILNKYIGASEKSVRDLFERAQAAKPCILFFDEFDSIAPRRGHDSTGVTDRVVNQMLTQMDGAEGLDGVYVLAATSRPDLIDPALLRPGRLDKSIICDMPSYQDRIEIMQACSRKISLSPSINLASYASKTEGFSGADLQALIYNAHLDAIHSELSVDLDTNSKETAAQGLVYTTFGGSNKVQGKVRSRAEESAETKRLELILSTLAEKQQKVNKTPTALDTPSMTKSKVTHVQPFHLDKALKSTRPSVPEAERARLRRIYSQFVDGRSPNGLPSGEPSDQVGGRSSLM